MGYLWFLALVLSTPIFCQAPPAKSNSQPTVEQVFRLHEAWGPGASSRGAALSMREISRNGQMFLYRMYAVGLPQEDRYSFFTWPITKEGTITLTPAQLSMLLEGLEWRITQKTWAPTLAG